MKSLLQKSTLEDINTLLPTWKCKVLVRESKKELTSFCNHFQSIIFDLLLVHSTKEVWELRSRRICAMGLVNN